VICPHCGYDNVPGAEACDQCSQDLTHLDRPVAHDRVERAFMENAVHVLRPPKAVAISPGTSIRDAINTMIQNNMGAVLIVDNAGQLIGILSERDVLMRVLDGRDRATELPVEQFMTHNPEAVGPDDRINFVVHKMAAAGYRHVPVVSGGRPVGMVSVRDIIRFAANLC
jgi:CBS domain-containing protein